MNTETETPSEYGSDKPVGDVGEVVERLKSMSILMLYKLGHKKAVEDAIDLLQSQARENAEKDYRIASLETTLANDPKHWGVHKQIAELTAENAALESTIEGLELDIEGYQQKSQELKDEAILSDIAFDQMQSDIETLTAENAALTSQRDVAYGLIKAAKCPCCDGGGAYYGNMGEVCQCQWCYEAARIRGEK